MGQRLLETTSPLLHFFVSRTSFLLLGWKGLLSTQSSAENQYSISFFLFYVSCLVFSCCCWGGNSFEGDRASFSQMCRLSFAFLFMSWLVVAGGGQVAVVTGHEAKLLWPSHALDDGEKITWNNVPSFAPLVYCISLLFLRKKSLSTCCCWASFSTVLFALYFFYCGSLLFLGWTVFSLRNSLPPLLFCLLLLLLAWKGFRRGWGQLLSAVASFFCIPPLVLVCCCWGWQVAVFRDNSRWWGKGYLKQPHLYCTSCVSLLLFVSGLERFLSKQALADNQLSPSAFTFTFDVWWFSTCCCWDSFSTGAFALQSSSCGCLLFLGWTGCSFRDYSMRQRFLQVA